MITCDNPSHHTLIYFVITLAGICKTLLAVWTESIIRIPEMSKARPTDHAVRFLDTPQLTLLTASLQHGMLSLTLRRALFSKPKEQETAFVDVVMNRKCYSTP